MALTNDQILAGNDDIQTRNKVLQADFKIANANRQKLLGALTRVAPVSTESFAERGLTNRNQAFRTPEDQLAHADYTKQLADSDKEMAGITARAQQITKDATAFKTSIGAQNIASGTGVPLKYQGSAPSASASPAATAGATAPAGGASTIDPLFKDTKTSAGMTPQQIVAQSADEQRAVRAVKTASGPTVDLGASSEYGGGGKVTNSLASSVDKNGVPTFDNASIQKMLERNGQSMPAGGAAQYPAAAQIYNPPVQQIVPQTVSAPMVADSRNFAMADNPTQRLLRDLGTQIFRASANPNSRSKRELVAQLYGQQAALLNQGNQIASNENIANNNRNADLTKTNMTEAGATNRTNLTEAGANSRTNATLQNQVTTEGMRQNGDTYRTLLGAMPKPQYTTDDKGNYVQINGATWTPVMGADGQPLKLPQDKSGIERIKAEAPYFGEALKTLNAQAADPGASQEERSAAAAQARAILQRSPFGGQPQAPAAPKAGDVQQGYRFKGGNPADKANWEKVN